MEPLTKDFKQNALSHKKTKETKETGHKKETRHTTEARETKETRKTKETILTKETKHQTDNTLMPHCHKKFCDAKWQV